MPSHISAEAREPFWSTFSAAVCTLMMFFLLSSNQVHAKDGLGPDFWEKYDDITDWITLRLKLTPEQEDLALPILEQNFENQLAVLGEYGIKPGHVPKLTREQKEEIDAKIIGTRADTRAKLVKLLKAEQLEELKAIQREYHEEFRKRLAEH